MLKAKSKIHIYEGKALVYIPSKIHLDSAFPFKNKDEVDIEIINKQIMIRKRIKNQKTIG